MQSIFGPVPSASQMPNIDFGARMSPIVAPANIFEGEVDFGSNAIAGPSVGGLGGQGVGKKTMAPNWGRMMVRPSPNVAFPLRVVEMRKRERRENFESYLEDNW